jgi:hypothetical protein
MLLEQFDLVDSRREFARNDENEKLAINYWKEFKVLLDTSHCSIST